jgi:hypothetical protein
MKVQINDNMFGCEKKFSIKGTSAESYILEDAINKTLQTPVWK